MITSREPVSPVRSTLCSASTLIVVALLLAGTKDHSLLFRASRGPAGSPAAELVAVQQATTTRASRALAGADQHKPVAAPISLRGPTSTGGTSAVVSDRVAAAAPTRTVRVESLDLPPPATA